MVLSDNEIYVLSCDSELSKKLRQSYHNKLGETPFNALIASVRESELKEVAACVFSNKVIYSAAKGGARIGIIRNGSAATILQSENENVISASGYPKEGDLLKLSLTNLQSETLEINTPTFKPINIFKNFLQKIPQRNIYLRNEETPDISAESKKLSFTIAAILLGLLAVSIGFGIRQKGINDTKNKYEGILQQAQNEVDQAISLASVDADRSRQLFSDSEQKLNQITSMKINDPKVDALSNKINSSRGAILGEYIETPQMFLDLTLLSSGFKGDTIAFSGGTIYILDKGGQRIVSVDISTKKSLVVSGPSVLSSPEGLAAYETNVYALEGDGIYEVDSGPSKVIDKTWPGDAFIAAFAGNIYVMDKEGGEIYRYQGLNGAFPNQEKWLSASTNADFSNVSQIAIDGSIYALYPNSKILKFAQGSSQSFRLTGIVPDIGSIDAIYASPDNQYLYLLDKAGSRVVVIDKTGKYKAQYVDLGISQAINLVASETDKKIILLTGDKLYSIDLQN